MIESTPYLIGRVYAAKKEIIDKIIDESAIRAGETVCTDVVISMYQDKSQDQNVEVVRERMRNDELLKVK